MSSDVASFKAIGHRLRRLFDAENEPLSWQIIDSLERLAEVCEARDATGSLEPKTALLPHE